jgi:hypothetical protein
LTRNAILVRVNETFGLKPLIVGAIFLWSEWTTPDKEKRPANELAAESLTVRLVGQADLRPAGLSSSDRGFEFPLLQRDFSIQQENTRN